MILHNQQLVPVVRVPLTVMGGNRHLYHLDTLHLLFRVQVLIILIQMGTIKRVRIMVLNSVGCIQNTQKILLDLFLIHNF